jgi:hypothetical protein
VSLLLLGIGERRRWTAWWNIKTTAMTTSIKVVRMVPFEETICNDHVIGEGTTH